jgi:methionyl-tRNA formyltransferase
MRILLLGGTDLTLAVGERLRKIGLSPVGVVHVLQQFRISYSLQDVKNVRFTDLAAWCESIQLPHRPYKDTKTIAEFADDVGSDFCLAAGWFHMVPADLRAKFSRGTAGIHASLLPRLRGGAPLNWAILSGERETGVTLFALGDGVDDGPVYGQEHLPIGPRTGIGDLVKAAESAALTLVERCVPAIAEGHLVPTPQVGEPTYCLQRTPEDGAIDWSKSAEDIDRLVRAVGRPYSGAFSWLDGRKVIIWAADPRSSFPSILGAVGQIARVADQQDPFVVAGQGSIVVREASDETGEDVMRVLRRSANKRFRHQA